MSDLPDKLMERIMEPAPELALIQPPLTKIVATVGPACADAATIARMIASGGVSVFRLNFSHGTLETHRDALSVIRTQSQDLGRPVGVMGDLQGPKIRLGDVVEGGIDLVEGMTVSFERGAPVGALDGDDGARLGSTYDKLVDELAPGHRVLIADGAVRLLVTDVAGDRATCTVTTGGHISSRKGINLPDTPLSLPALTERDHECLRWAIENDLDFLALSFVRRADDIAALKKLISSLEGPQTREHQCTPVIAKIEHPAAVERIESIVEIADGIMIARGDLGVEMDIARVPVVQKDLLRIAQDWGKPCIVATQMLESMVSSPTPTRAEASDVANAIFDETDAVMLSAETAAGRYPLLAVEAMRRIADQTEAWIDRAPPRESAPRRLIETRHRTAALAHGAWTIAQDLGAKFIVVWSQHGGGARYLSQNNFRIPILAVTSDDQVARRMQLLRGVTPIRMPLPDSTAHFTRQIDGYLLGAGWAAPGDPSIIIAGEPIGRPRVTNSLAIHLIGSEDTGYAAFGSP